MSKLNPVLNRGLPMDVLVHLQDIGDLVFSEDD